MRCKRLGGRKWLATLHGLLEEADPFEPHHPNEPVSLRLRARREPGNADRFPPIRLRRVATIRVRLRQY